MRPLRAARSSSFTAANFAALLAPGAAAFFTAVRKAARCARLRTVAARVLRMFFLADAIFGTNSISDTIKRGCFGERLKLEFKGTKVKAR